MSNYVPPHLRTKGKKRSMAPPQRKKKTKKPELKFLEAPMSVRESFHASTLLNQPLTITTSNRLFVKSSVSTASNKNCIFIKYPSRLQNELQNKLITKVPVAHLVKGYIGFHSLVEWKNQLHLRVFHKMGKRDRLVVSNIVIIGGVVLKVIRDIALTETPTWKHSNIRIAYIPHERSYQLITHIGGYKPYSTMFSVGMMKSHVWFKVLPLQGVNMYFTGSHAAIMSMRRIAPGGDHLGQVIQLFNLSQSKKTKKMGVLLSAETNRYERISKRPMSRSNAPLRFFNLTTSSYHAIQGLIMLMKIHPSRVAPNSVLRKILSETTLFRNIFTDYIKY